MPVLLLVSLVPSLVQLGWEGSKEQVSQENKAQRKWRGNWCCRDHGHNSENLFNSHIAICTL